MKIYPFKRCPLSKPNSFDQNFMKLCHIVCYHDVFFNFDNGLYGTIKSSVDWTSVLLDEYFFIIIL